MHEILIDNSLAQSFHWFEDRERFFRLSACPEVKTIIYIVKRAVQCATLKGFGTEDYSSPLTLVPGGL